MSNQYQIVFAAFDKTAPSFSGQSPLEQALEALVDATSIAEVLDCLASVCLGKAEHVRENWQDGPLATAWAHVGTAVENAADGPYVAGLS